MGCRYWVFGLFVLMVASFAPAVRADDLDACSNANPDIRISGCSAIIDAGTASREIANTPPGSLRPDRFHTD